MVSGEHEVYFHYNYLPQFINDIKMARSLIVIQCPFLGRTQLDQIIEYLVAAIRRGVRVCVFVELPTWPLTDERERDRQECLERLKKIGVHITLRPLIHEKLAIIDDRVAWEATLNMLSHYNSSERLNRWTCKAKIEEIRASHRLDACDECLAIAGFSRTADIDQQIAAVRKHIGAEALSRRKRLKLSQQQVASLAGCRQADVSRLERGTGHLDMEKLVSISLALGLGLRALPWYTLPRIDGAVELQHKVNAQSAPLKIDKKSSA